MNAEQLVAYEWAKKQNYTSVAAQYAKLLTDAIDNLQANYDKISDFEHNQCAKLLAENSELRIRLAKINDLAVGFEEDGPFYDPQEAFDRVREIDNLSNVEKQSVASGNLPLTLEQLRQMDSEPVYIVEWPDWGHWELCENAEDYLENMDEDFYGMTMPPTIPDPMGKYGLHMMGWLAYAHKPECLNEYEETKQREKRQYGGS